MGWSVCASEKLTDSVLSPVHWAAHRNSLLISSAVLAHGLCHWGRAKYHWSSASGLHSICFCSGRLTRALSVVVVARAAVVAAWLAEAG